jgi:2'-5' RNA ligase
LAQRTLSVVRETDPDSAVVVTVRLPVGLARLRRRLNPSATADLPAHVTLLFPFLPVAGLSSEARAVLAEIARRVAAFEVRFADLGRFSDVTYLVPEPSAPFAELTSAIAERWPEFPPYGGAHREIVPHLTLADTAEVPLDTIALSARRFLPFSRKVSTIEVLAQRGDGRWHRQWRLPLGVRP